MNWFNLIMAMLPVLQQAVKTVSEVEGKTPEAAVADVINHLTPGAPNAPALGEHSTISSKG
jgi:hypothetical protein